MNEKEQNKIKMIKVSKRMIRNSSRGAGTVPSRRQQVPEKRKDFNVTGKGTMLPLFNVIAIGITLRGKARYDPKKFGSSGRGKIPLEKDKTMVK